MFGFASNIEILWEFNQTRRFFERLASFSRLILFDKRGTGLSDPVPAGASIEERMDDVRAVMDAVGSEKAVVFGYSEGGPMSARIGGDFGGIAVHIAARVAEAAAPGEVLVSSTVRDLVTGSGISFEARGRRTLKGVPGRWPLFAPAA